MKSMGYLGRCEGCTNFVTNVVVQVLEGAALALFLLVPRCILSGPMAGHDLEFQ